MFCKDCTFFKPWKAIGTAICQATSRPVKPTDKACKDFTPKGRYGEWGEDACGYGGKCR